MSFADHRALPLALLLVACPGSTSDTDSSTTGTTGTTSTGTTADVPTSSGDSPTSSSTGDTGDTAADCSDSRLISSWTLPEDTTCFGVAMDGSGAVMVLAGEDDSDDYHAELYRYVDGALEWSLIHPPLDQFVRPHAFAVRDDGVTVIAGFASDPTPGSFETLPWTAAYDATGALLWEHVDSTDACDSPPCRKGRNQGVVVTADGDFLVAGERGLYTDFEFKVSAVLRRYDAATGEVAVSEFATPFDDDDDETKAIALRADGGVVLVGETYPEPFSPDLWVARLAADGTLESIDSFAAGEDDVVQHVAALSDGSIVISARADDFYAARLDAALNSLWYTPTAWYGPVIAGPDNSVYAAVDDFRIVDLIDPDGERQWADDECLANYGASALGLSPDGTRLLVCRHDMSGTHVEIYDAT